jgi:catechol 2,3-dioxygenase-like lactoylglutathione lyase family enzyme
MKTQREIGRRSLLVDEQCKDATHHNLTAFAHELRLARFVVDRTHRRPSRSNCHVHSFLQKEFPMQLKFISVMVDDQQKALDFYAGVLGFEKCADIPLGEYRWLTVASPDGIEGVELVLEPLAFPPARVYQQALYDAGIPATALITKDIRAEYQRLAGLGVVFRGEPAEAGPIITTVFEDTCGNLINLVQPLVAPPGDHA